MKFWATKLNEIRRLIEMINPLFDRFVAKGRHFYRLVILYVVDRLLPVVNLTDVEKNRWKYYAPGSKTGALD